MKHIVRHADGFLLEYGWIFGAFFLVIAIFSMLFSTGGLLAGLHGASWSMLMVSGIIFGISALLTAFFYWRWDLFK